MNHVAASALLFINIRHFSHTPHLVFRLLLPNTSYTNDITSLISILATCCHRNFFSHGTKQSPLHQINCINRQTVGDDARNSRIFSRLNSPSIPALPIFAIASSVTYARYYENNLQTTRIPKFL